MDAAKNEEMIGVLYNDCYGNLLCLKEQLIYTIKK